jgi:nucleoside-triphosphatase THEP1
LKAQNGFAMQLYESNSQLRLAANYICYTNKHLFLTGKAGTGKTTFLRNLKNITFKRHVIVAPTGVAAINAGGVTIHSFFQLPFGPQIPEELAKHIATDQKDAKHAASRFQRFTREKVNIIKSIDLLVIDEISMVRADMLDAIDAVLRRLRNRETPFGGVQLLMIGDLQQLAPIAKDDEWKLLRDYYDSVYFFSSKALQKTDYVSIELTKIYRQRDEEFINLLGKVRDNNLDAGTLAALAKRYIPDFKPNEDEGYITLTTHNYQARDINAYWLNAVKGKEFIYEATIRDEFPEYNYPTEKKLILKAGAQVMFVKNDPSPLKEFFNGKIGKIIRIDDDTIYVKCPDDESPIAVTPLEWHNCRYTLDEQTKEIEETVIGSFTQYPLKLAWAVTIHKSQGLTFNKAIIDARQAFAHGQVYVALSRCRTLGGLVLSTSITPESLKNDYKVGKFIRQLEENVPNENQLQAAKNEFQHSLISELFDFSLFRRRLTYLQKIVRDNIRSFEPGIGEILSLAETNLKIEIMDVAEKFMVQVKWHLGQNPEIEKNETLQDRIKKACQYFTPRFEKIFLKSLPGLESDNKVLRKSANELIQRLLNEALIRLDCLRTCTNGFTVAQYLEARAKSSIEMPASAKKTTEREISAADVAHPKLLKRLKAWRDNHAREQDLTHYQVISRTAIFEIADKLPVSRKELLAINGIGQKKVKKYGSELLEMIGEYIEENALEKAIDFNPLEVEVKEKKPDTKKLSLELFNNGQNIQEIAKGRGLAASTIEGHLSHFVGTGEIPVHKLISQEKSERITRFFDSAEDFSIGPAKIALGDEVSWGELRIVVKHLEWQRGKDSAKQK